MLRLTIFLAAATAGTVAEAHHSTIGIFDSDRTVEVTGTVKSVSWRNPHGRIVLEVPDDSGGTVEWQAETASISVLRNRGVVQDQEFIAAGDRITIAGSPARRDARGMLARNVLLPSGYEFDFGTGMPYFPAGKSGKLVGRAIDEAKVQRAAAAADGIFRVWSTIMSDPDAFPMFKGGYPLTAAAEAGLAQWNPLDNALLHCGTKGTPLIMITPLPIEFVREGENIRMRIEEYDARRLIHMDGAAPPEEHTLFGFSRGHWEGSALVVATDHVAAGYFDHEGTPQSDQITVVERFMPNEAYDRLDYRITVTDPVYFSKPFDLTRYFVWWPEMTVHAYECLERY